MPATANEHPRVPLTRFHNNTGEFLDLATKQPVVLTSHGRERHVIADSEYFRHLEQAARYDRRSHDYRSCRFVRHDRSRPPSFRQCTAFGQRTRQ